MTPSWDENMGYQLEQDAEELAKDPAYEEWLDEMNRWFTFTMPLSPEDF